MKKETDCCECDEIDGCNISTRFGWLCPDCVDKHFAAFEVQVADREAECGMLRQVVANLEAGIDAQDGVLSAKYNEQLLRADKAEAALALTTRQLELATAKGSAAEVALAEMTEQKEGYRLDAEFFRNEYNNINRTIGNQLAAAREKIANQAERIRVLEGATNHAGGLRAQPDDAERVERVVRELATMDGWTWEDLTHSLRYEEYKSKARAVLEVADGKRD